MTRVVAGSVPDGGSLSAGATPPATRRALDPQVLGIWLASRVGVAMLALAGAGQLSGVPAGRVRSFLTSWDRWDVGLFRKVAEYGYQGYPVHYPDRGIEAFFPGFPLVLAVAHRLVSDWTAAGLLVSLLAGAVAAGALARLAALDGVSGSRAVLYLVLSPYAVFLAAGYSEALFLALALPGWWCARRGYWRPAGLLVAGACAVRINGAFLAVALLVQYVVTVRRLRPDAGWLLAPYVVLLGFAGYLHLLTGDWLRWPHAQQEGWDRRFTLPWTAFRTTLHAARDQVQGAEYAWAWWAEILAVLIGLIVTAVLLRRRRWGEATYLALSVGALATSTYYLSVSRATLLWFPLWLLLAQAAARRPWLHAGYLALSAALMAVGVLTFTAGRWVG